MSESYQLLAHGAEVERLRAEKYQNLKNALKREALDKLCPDLTGARTRLDLMWSGKELGLKVATPTGAEFKALKNFDTATPEIVRLSEWFSETCPYTDIMNVRFRASFDGNLKGLWLDASRDGLQLIKTQHSAWIRHAITEGMVIEAGQRNEEWVCDQNDASVIKSTRPKLRPWLPSYTQQLEPIALGSTIAAFSQPGPLANQTILKAGHRLLDLAALDIQNSFSWGEWGAGNGNLSASFAERLGAKHAWISEPDPRAFEALKSNHAKFFSDAKISRTAAITAPESFKLWILDPPKSGFSELIHKLEPGKKPENILIYHCALEGLERDSKELKSQGYTLKDWIFCDVFPGSKHAEAVSLWAHKPC